MFNSSELVLKHCRAGRLIDRLFIGDNTGRFVHVPNPWKTRDKTGPKWSLALVTRSEEVAVKESWREKENEGESVCERKKERGMESVGQSVKAMPEPTSGHSI